MARIDTATVEGVSVAEYGVSTESPFLWNRSQYGITLSVSTVGSLSKVMSDRVHTRSGLSRADVGGRGAGRSGVL